MIRIRFVRVLLYHLFLRFAILCKQTALDDISLISQTSQLYYPFLLKLESIYAIKLPITVLIEL